MFGRTCKKAIKDLKESAIIFKKICGIPKCLGCIIVNTVAFSKNKSNHSSTIKFLNIGTVHISTLTLQKLNTETILHRNIFFILFHVFSSTVVEYTGISLSFYVKCGTLTLCDLLLGRSLDSRLKQLLCTVLEENRCLNVSDEAMVLFLEILNHWHNDPVKGKRNL